MIIGSYSGGSASADRYSTFEELLSQLPDNTANQIQASDIRDSVWTLWNKAIDSNSRSMEFGNIVNSDDVANLLPYPLTAPVFGPIIRSQAFSLWKNFESHSNFLFDIIEENGHIIKEAQFNILDDLITYLNTNLSNNGVSFDKKWIIRVYANIRGEYSNINIRGYNLLFSILKGRGQYSDKKTKTLGSGNLTISDQVVSAVYTESGWTPPSINARKTFWFSSDRKKMYSLFKTKNTQANKVSAPSLNKDCYFYKPSTFEFVISSADILFDDNTSAYNTNRTGILLLDLTNNIILSPMFGKDNDYVGTHNEFKSMIKYHRFYAQTLGVSRYAWFLKPIGVDTFILDYIKNMTGAKLYAYVKNKKSSASSYVVDITPLVEEKNTRNNNCSWRIRKSTIDTMLWGKQLGKKY